MISGFEGRAARGKLEIDASVTFLRGHRDGCGEQYGTPGGGDSAPAYSRLDRYNRSRHGRQQPKPLPSGRAIRRTRKHTRSGSAAVPLLIAGLLLSWAAAPGWTELVMMWPNRVGGISGACSEAFRPYNPVLSALTGFCYWWGWVPTCGLTAIMSASAIQQWYLPGVRIEILATCIVAFFAIVNLCGIRWTVRLATPIAATSAGLAFVSAMAPVLSGHVNWVQASTFHLNVPFSGWFGSVTSLMAGLYLIGFAAPAFEAAACHVGETINPKPQCAARDACQRPDGRGVFHHPANRVAWRARSRTARQKPCAGPRPHFCTVIRQLRQGSRDLLHDVPNMFHGIEYSLWRAHRAHCHSLPMMGCCRAHSAFGRRRTPPG